MKEYRSELFLAVTAMVILGSVVFLFVQNKITVNSTDSVAQTEVSQEPVLKYGYDISNHYFEKHPIKSGSFIGDILMSQNINYQKILELEKKAEEVFSLKKIMAGKDITLVKKTECDDPFSFVYAPNKFSYVEYVFGDSVLVHKKNIPFETCTEFVTGSIQSTLSEAMTDKGLSFALTDQLEDALAQVYFPHAQKGDQFKLIVDRKYIEGKPAGTGEILAASYKSGNSESFGFYYENERYKGYYDLEGTPNKKTFLRAPVRASRISSGYNLNRYHPVLKVRRAHLGTDYAAPRGTQIFSVASGVITKRSYTKGNGNYIKIKHDGTYDSQYLHMSKFKSGLRVGSRVKQGQVIGYVGSTGLATGPHVCFRFWKKGRQINHLRENFPPLDPMPKESLPAFYDVRDDYLRFLTSMPYENESELVYASMTSS